MHFLVAHGYETPAFHMAAPYIAYLPTSGCRALATCVRLFIGNAAKANPQYSFKSAPYPSLADVLVRTTASVDLTTPTCRLLYELDYTRTIFYITQMEGFWPIYPYKARTLVLTRSTEGLSAPLASLLHAIYVSNNLSDFCCWSGTTSHLLGRDVYIHQAFAILRVTRGFRRMYVASPICVLGRVEGAEPSSTAWKAVIISVIRYPHINFLFLLYKYYNANSTKNQI